MSADNHTRGLTESEWKKAVFERCAAPQGYLLDPQQFQDLDEWKTKLCAKVEELLRVGRPAAAPAVKILGEKACEGYLRRDVTISVTPDWQIPAWVLIPMEGSPPFPGIVALHDWGGFMYYGRAKLVEVDDPPEVLRAFKKKNYGGRSIASDLARRGYAVLVTDAFGFGDRRLMNEEAEQIEASDKALEEVIELINPIHKVMRETGSGRVVTVAGGTWPGLLFDDDGVAFRWFAGLNEVDPDRIGCIGLSCGAWRSAHLAALGPGIACAVAVGWMSTLSHIVNSRGGGTGVLGGAHLISGLTRYADYPHVVALAAPRPFLSIQGRQDRMFPEQGVERAWEIIGDVYARRGAPDRFRGSWHDAPHCFDLGMQEEAFQWLDRWVKG